MLFPAGFSGYLTSQVDAIIEAGGGLARGRSRNDLKQALETTINNAQIQDPMRKWMRMAPAPANDFAKIARASERLLKLLGVAIDGKPHVAPKLRYRLRDVGSSGHDGTSMRSSERNGFPCLRWLKKGNWWARAGKMKRQR